MGLQLLQKTPAHTILFYFLILVVISSAVQTKEKPQANLCQRLHQAVSFKLEKQLETTLRQAQQTIHEPCFLEMTPRYYWAQNMSHIMVKFQFLNSRDTSACSKVLSVKKHLDHNQFSVKLLCLQSTYVIRYSITVRTFMPMNHYHSVWKTAQQNTIILECLKSPTPYFWKTLYVDKHVPLRKPELWWKMIQKYRENLGNFIYQLQVEDEQSDISAYVKQKRRAKKTELAELYNPNSDKYLYCNQVNPFQLGSWIF